MLSQPLLAGGSGGIQAALAKKLTTPISLFPTFFYWESLAHVTFVSVPARTLLKYSV